MEIANKKRNTSLGIRIGAVFLTTVIVVILIAYFVLFKNFQNLMTDYTIKLVESMISQGVRVVEKELEADRQEASFLANSFEIPDSNHEAVVFPQPYEEAEYLRMLYVTEEGTITSDGRKRDVRKREDIRAALGGEAAVYGPYFNEEDEFVICYSVPIKKNSEIVGVFSIEKDGYLFSELIENIRFVNSGECYIIDENGTDIAVSDKNHLDWVESQYNAREIYKEQPDAETKSILELEQKGLDGETGVGTYYWNDGLCYVFYKPIPSTGWVLLAGLREEEIVTMTQSAMVDAVSKSPILALCVLVVILLTGLVAYWIISSTKKSAEINAKLNIIANYDVLTGLMNRNSYHSEIDDIADGKSELFACMYVDVNGLHELNNLLGHEAGDEMLKAVSSALTSVFPNDKVYRIGGDEFVVLFRKEPQKEMQKAIGQLREVLSAQNYEISIGIAYRDEGAHVENVVNIAEENMREDKRLFYQNKGNNRRMRSFDKRLEKMLREKQDADTFLAFLAPEFKGVYFVNLGNDTIRHLYIPSYFEGCLEESGDRFSEALHIYAHKIVEPEYYHCLEELCDYTALEKKLDEGQTPEVIYQKLNGDWMKVQVLKFKEYKEEQKETLWIFTNIEK